MQAQPMSLETSMGLAALPDPRMFVHEREKQQAGVIKAALAGDPEVEEGRVSDFFCVQLALVDGNEVASAVERTRHLQMFQDEYKIQNTVDEAVAVMKTFLQRVPGYILTLSFNPEEGKYVVSMDMEKLHKSWLRKEENMKCLLLFDYYLANAFCPDFFAIRQGFYCVMECEGYHWKNFDVGAEYNKRIWEEILIPYPIIFRQMKFFNGGVMASLVVGLLKKLAPKRITDKIEMSNEFGIRLDQAFCQPNLEAANQRFLSRVESCLRLRAHNERTFRLDTA
jgi:hypothetical protein